MAVFWSLVLVKSGQPRLQCESSNALHSCARMSVVKYFRIFRSRMTSVRARRVQEQACFSDIDLAKPEWRHYNTSTGRMSYTR